MEECEEVVFSSIYDFSNSRALAANFFWKSRRCGAASPYR
jgi:hypothetical protein